MLSYSSMQKFGARGFFMSNEGVQQFNCQTHLVRFVSNNLHVGPDGAGRVIFSIPPESRWHPVGKEGVEPTEEHLTCRARG
jgi:hypothetical protein